MLHLLLSAVTISILYGDFQKDKGRFLAAKICHAIVIILLVLYLAESIQQILWIVRDFDKVSAIFYTEAGILSAEVSLAAWMARAFIGTWMLGVLVMMMQRKEKARKQFFTLLIFIAFSEVFNFYRGFSLDGSSSIPDAIVFVIGIIFYGGIVTGIIVLYKSLFMRTFFTGKAPEQRTANVLDSDFTGEKL